MRNFKSVFFLCFAVVALVAWIVLNRFANIEMHAPKRTNISSVRGNLTTANLSVVGSQKSEFSQMSVTARTLHFVDKWLPRNAFRNFNVTLWIAYFALTFSHSLSVPLTHSSFSLSFFKRFGVRFASLSTRFQWNALNDVDDDDDGKNDMRQMANRRNPISTLAALWAIRWQRDESFIRELINAHAVNIIA